MTLRCDDRKNNDLKTGMMMMLMMLRGMKYDGDEDDDNLSLYQDTFSIVHFL